MNNEIKYVSPFKKLCITVGNLPTAYIESMSYYEGLTFLVNYLSNNVIPALNNNGEAVKELQDKYVELKQYVDDYFENLDVQEEINNKLDDMAESGQLTDIIAQYLGLAGMIAYDTVADMKLAENLVNGSKCQTLGFHSVNDGGGATYKVRTITNDDVVDEATIIALYDDTLIAELIINNEINLEQFGAYGDGTHDDTEKIQIALNSNVKNIKFNKYYKITSSLTISTSKNLYFENSQIEQATWGYSAFIIDSNNVNFYGKCKLINNQERTVITVPSIEGVTDAKSTCAGIYIKLNKNNLYFDDLYIKGFVCGITYAGSSTNIEKVKINNLSVETVDFGFIGNGINYLTFNNVYFKNITNSQNEPTHVIYITQNDTTYKGLYINLIQGEGAIETDDAGCILSIKSMENYAVNEIVCDDIIGIITAINSSGTIDSVNAKNIHGIGFKVNNSSNLTINNCNVETDSTTSPLYSSLGNSNLIINNSISTINEDSTYSVFYTSDGSMTINNPNIIYSDTNTAYTCNSTGSGDFYLIEPKISNHSKILKTSGRTTPYNFIINPELVTLASDSFFIGGSGTGTNYQVFNGKAYQPTVLNLNETEPHLEYSNYFKLTNTSEISLERIYGVQGQEITLVNDSSSTNLVNGSYIKTKTNATITGSNWKIAKFIIYGGVAYQL